MSKAIDSRPSSRKPARHTVTEVDILNGQAKADLVRDSDPSGKIVLHAIRKNSYVHERMFNNGKGSIPKESFDAAEQFRRYFERGHLAGHFAKLDMCRTSGGRSELNDGTVNARRRAIESLDALGRQRDGSPNHSANVVWHCVGEGHTLEEWVQRVRWANAPMDKGRAAGILMASLERLSLFYGMIRIADVKEAASKRHFAKGVTYLHQFINVYSSGLPVPDKEAVKRLLAQIEKHMSRYIETSSP